MVAVHLENRKLLKFTLSIFSYLYPLLSKLSFLSSQNNFFKGYDEDLKFVIQCWSWKCSLLVRQCIQNKLNTKSDFLFVFGHKFTLFLLLYSIKKFLITFIIPNHCLQVKHTTHCAKNNLNLRIGACHSWSNGICLVYGSYVRHLPLYSICSNCARFRIFLFY